MALGFVLLGLAVLQHSQRTPNIISNHDSLVTRLQHMPSCYIDSFATHKCVFASRRASRPCLYPPMFPFLWARKWRIRRYHGLDNRYSCIMNKVTVNVGDWLLIVPTTPTLKHSSTQISTSQRPRQGYVGMPAQSRLTSHFGFSPNSLGPFSSSWHFELCQLRLVSTHRVNNNNFKLGFVSHMPSISLLSPSNSGIPTRSVRTTSNGALFRQPHASLHSDA